MEIFHFKPLSLGRGKGEELFILGTSECGCQKRVQKCLFFRMAKSRDLGLFVRMLLQLFVKMLILLDDLCKMLRIKARVSSKAQLHTRQVLENCTDSTPLLEKMANSQVSSYQPVYTLKFVLTELYSFFFFKKKNPDVVICPWKRQNISPASP